MLAFISVKFVDALFVKSQIIVMEAIGACNREREWAGMNVITMEKMGQKAWLG